MQWFRLYHEMLEDQKIGTLTDAQFRTWVEVLCLACLAENGGNTNMTINSMEWKLRRKISKHIDTLIERGLINLVEEKIFVCKWAKRQYTDNTSTKRVTKYRDRIKNMGLAINGYTRHRETVTLRDGNRCIYCGSSKNLCLDHILPILSGGDDSIENIGLACKECNSGKSGRTPEEAGYQWFNISTKKIWQQWMNNRNGCNGEV